MKKLLMVLCIAMILLSITLAATAEEALAPSIAAKQESITLALGKTVDIKINYFNSSKELKRAGLLFESSNESIAEVNRNGRVKAIANGECIVTVISKQDETVRTEIPVSVITPVKKVQAACEPNKLLINETAQITYTLIPETATMQQVVFKSTKDSVATVDENGVVTAVSKGTATIVVESADGAAKCNVKVTVQSRPESVHITNKDTYVNIGRSLTLKAEVLPKNADDRHVTWTSTDESIATIDKNGRVKPIAPGIVEFTATSTADSAIKDTISIEVHQLAKSIAFEEKTYYVTLGESMQLNPIVLPASTTDSSVTYKSAKPKIVSVDDNGVITALDSGNTTITVKTADGSKRTAKVTIQVITPVTGVNYAKDGVRVGVNYHTTVTVDIIPKAASNKNMTWYSGDESIAVVTGTNNKARISGRSWGRTTITGVTEDGGYQVTFHANIGSLRNAVKISSVGIKNNMPNIVLKNTSNMMLTKVYLAVQAWDVNGDPIMLSVGKDPFTLNGDYDYLYPGDRSDKSNFSFYKINVGYPNIAKLAVTVTGFETDDGYYDNDGNLQYKYRLSADHYNWVTSD